MGEDAKKLRKARQGVVLLWLAQEKWRFLLSRSPCLDVAGPTLFDANTR